MNELDSTISSNSLDCDENLQVYKQKKDIYLKHKNQYDQYCQTESKMKEELNSLEQERRDLFELGLSQINYQLKKIYRALNGTEADAELEKKSMNPFDKGIEFTVKPHKKTWKRMELLSGGEKTMASLALIFALHQYKPSPFYLMDEIDAALDVINVQKIAHFILTKSQSAQFIIVSHRREMIEFSATLIGILKVSGVSQSFTADQNIIRNLQSENYDRTRKWMLEKVNKSVKQVLLQQQNQRWEIQSQKNKEKEDYEEEIPNKKLNHKVHQEKQIQDNILKDKNKNQNKMQRVKNKRQIRESEEYMESIYD